MASTLKGFISYSSKDEYYKKRLQTFLAPLKREGLISVWDFRELLAGSEWDEEISTKLEEADIILLLISADFLDSEYSISVELQRALERHEQNTAKVIPVILRHCDWKTQQFQKLQALPSEAKPIKSWTDEDEAFTDVVKGIRVLIGKWDRAVPSTALMQNTTAEMQVIEIVSDEKTEFISSPNWPDVPARHAAVIVNSIHWARWNLPQVESASWIADRPYVSNQEAILGGEYHFKRIFEIPLKSKVRSAMLHFIVDDWVDFGLNGKTVINFEEDARLVTLDVAEHIRLGKNEIFLKVRNRSFEEAIRESSPAYNLSFANKINKYEDNPYGIRFRLEITYSRAAVEVISNKAVSDVGFANIRSVGNVINLSLDGFWEPTDNDEFEIAIGEALLYDRRKESFELVITQSELNSLYTQDKEMGDPRNPGERRIRLERSKRILELEQNQKWIERGILLLLTERALKGLWLAGEASLIIALRGYLKYYDERVIGRAQGIGFDVFRQHPNISSGIYLDLHERSELCNLWSLPDSAESLNAMVGHNPLSDLPNSIVTSKAIPAIIFGFVDYEARNGDLLPFEQSALLKLSDWGFGLK